MKKLISLLLALVLLLSMAACGKQAPAELQEEEPLPEAEPAPEPEPEPVPEPEPEPADPRALWAEAEAAADEYRSFEREQRSELSMVSKDIEFSSGSMTVTRAKNVDSRMVQYESVTTGDDPKEMYYINGRLYEENSNWQYSCSLGADQFRAYLTEDSIPFLPEQFETVELVSQENGWEIAFSNPQEDFAERFGELLQVSSMQLQADSLQASGTVILDEEGFYESVTMELSCAVSFYGSMEAECTVTMSDRWLSHDEEVSVVIPSKVENYTEVTDIRLLKKLEEAAAFHDLAVASDYTTALSFEGTRNGEPLALSYDVRTDFLRDVLAQTLQVNETSEFWVKYQEEEQTVTQQTDYADGIYAVTVNGETQKTEVAQETLYAIMDQDFCAYTRENEPEELFWYPHASSSDGMYSVFFYGTGYVELALYGSILQLSGFGAIDDIYTLVDYEMPETNGTIVIDEESRAICSILYDIEATFTLEDGTEIAGTVQYERNFLAYNDDVVLETGTGIGQTA